MTVEYYKSFNYILPKQYYETTLINCPTLEAITHFCFRHHFTHTLTEICINTKIQKKANLLSFIIQTLSRKSVNNNYAGRIFNLLR